MEPTRERAWETLTRYTKSKSLLRHALAVEASTAAYARKLGGDEELWRVAALLHDFDYEIHPTLDKHPQDGAPILREEGYPEEVVDTVLSHAEHLGLPRDTQLKKALFACDELRVLLWAPLFELPWLEFECPFGLLQADIPGRGRDPLLLVCAETLPELVADPHDRVVGLMLGHRQHRGHFVVLVDEIDVDGVLAEIHHPGLQ